MSDQTIVEVRIDWRRHLIVAAWYSLFSLFLLYKFLEIGGYWTSLMFWLGFILVVGLINHMLFEFSRLRLKADALVWRHFPLPQRIPLASIKTIERREHGFLPGANLVVAYVLDGDELEATIPLRIFRAAEIEVLLRELKRLRPDLIIPNI